MPRWLRIAAGCLCLSACAQSLLPPTGPAARETRAPRFRASGERIPAFSGGNAPSPAWQRVDALLWMPKEDAESFARGWIRIGATYERIDQADPARRDPTDALRLRTDHVLLQTNLPWARAREVARRAEAHVLRYLLTYGDVFDLRLPAAALRVVVHAHRAGFESRLRSLTVDPVGWGAFYDALSGTVHLSTEPAARGALPWLVDLRHEMTHQILDLARPAWRRRNAFGPGWFWLWEGVALHAEALGDPPGTDRAAPRRERFQKRLAAQAEVPLRELLRLRQSSFSGRHYDETAVLMEYLLDPKRPRLRTGILALVSRLMRANVRPSELEPALGMRLGDLQSAWLDSIPR